jgi:hypothetical protein
LTSIVLVAFILLSFIQPQALQNVDHHLSVVQCIEIRNWGIRGDLPGTPLYIHDYLKGATYGPFRADCLALGAIVTVIRPGNYGLAMIQFHGMGRADPHTLAAAVTFFFVYFWQYCSHFILLAQVPHNPAFWGIFGAARGQKGRRVSVK